MASGLDDTRKEIYIMDKKLESGITTTKPEPVTLTADQSCSDKLISIVQEDSIGTSVYYKGKQVLAYYCKKGTGEYVR